MDVLLGLWQRERVDGEVLRLWPTFRYDPPKIVVRD